MVAPGRSPARRGDAIGGEARAVGQAAGGHLAGGGAHDELAPAPLDGLDARSQHDRAASLDDPGGQEPAHRPEVDHRGGRDVQGGDAAGVRLDLGQPVRIEPTHLEAVGPRTTLEAVEAFHLVAVGGHHHLAAARHGHVVAPAPLEQLRSSAPAQLGLGRTRCVVHAGMDDPGVVPALVRGHPGLLVDHEHRRGRVPELDGPRRGQADDAGADDHRVGVAGQRSGRGGTGGEDREAAVGGGHGPHGGAWPRRRATTPAPRRSRRAPLAAGARMRR